MSAFLGPIHVKTYDKVLYQDDMSDRLLQLAEEHGWASGLRGRAGETAPPAVRQPLESIIDASNIHGWLSVAVANCEKRFAFIACALLQGHPERMEVLKSALRELGQAAVLSEGMDAETAFEAVHDILLDGMPCDFPFEVTDSCSGAVAWRIAQCPHAPYWQDSACGAEDYYRLRDAWMEGALASTAITHSRDAEGNASFRKGSSL